MSLSPLRETAVVVALLAAFSPNLCGASEERVDYNRDIRPILSNTCYTCHGPDEAERQGGFRLDTAEGAVAETDSGGQAIVPGDVAASLLLQRITEEDESLRMPPPEGGKQLTAEQTELIRRWIEQGAEFSPHWSFITPHRPALPQTRDTAWVRNPVDSFILAELEKRNLEPMPEASKEALIRRVTFDLTGLPPTHSEIDEFLADESPDAYEKLVDRLLASPHYGEHRTRYWLDAARYGDTHGLHLDNERSIWPYRDWVIDAFNQNRPFDEFTVEQLAGDLLPEPSMSQLVATGFNRCNVSTSEGGSIDDEVRVRYAVDRAETTGTVWLGLTVGCAACHDHKFDAISQREFYQFFAYFNNVTEQAMDRNVVDPPPTIRVPNEQQQAQLAEFDTQIAALEEQQRAQEAVVNAAQAEWEQQQLATAGEHWHPLAPSEFSTTAGSTLEPQPDGTLLARGENPSQETYEVIAPLPAAPVTAVRLESFVDDSLPQRGPGRAPNGNFVLSEIEAEFATADAPETWYPVRWVSATADYSQRNANYLIARAIDGTTADGSGWAINGHERHANATAVFYPAEPLPAGATVRVRLRHESQFAQHHIGRFRLAAGTQPAEPPLHLGTWFRVGPFESASGAEAYDTPWAPESDGVDLTSTYQDDQLAWEAEPSWIDGQPLTLGEEIAATYFYREIYTATARPLDVALGSDDAVKLWLNDQVVHDQNVERGLTADEDKLTLQLEPGVNRLLVKLVNYGGPAAFVFKAAAGDEDNPQLVIESILSTPVEQRNPEQQAQLREHYRATHAPEFQQLLAQVAEVREQRDTFFKQTPITLVMQEMEKPRETFVLNRGEYDKPGEQVTPGVPAALPALPEGAPATRLALANWLVDPQHPLTSRVTVNRFWQQFFGTGIVKTPEDFGAQGEWPSHPELLDWLAVELIESRWNVKQMIRLLVTSATYRQDSRTTAELIAVDPGNRLLARGPRHRLDAEVIRDNALAVSGLLNVQIGGPSVKPYQPSGIWEAVGYTSSNTANFIPDSGEKLYRRSMYTFWKRTAPPPGMTTFDAPSREACTVRRARTNTPLQALALMNDVQFVEAARHLAERIIREGGTTPQDRIRWAFRTATARWPSDEEVQILTEQYQSQLDDFRAEPSRATELLSVGESPRDDALDPAAHAAWTMISNLLLNLDETITRG